MGKFETPSVNWKLPIETMMGLTREAAASILTCQLYPVGQVGSGLPRLPIRKRNLDNVLPILFVHGVFHNRSTFAWLIQRLSLEGIRPMKDLNLLTTLFSIEDLAEKIRTEAKQLLKLYGTQKIHIVGHSLGGMVGRYFVQELGGDEMVATLTTLATPHQGTLLSRFSLLPNLRQLDPESRTIRKLQGSPLPRQTQIISISGNLDFVMVPKNTYFLPGARNIRLKGVGHAGLLYSRRVHQILMSHWVG